MKPTKPKSIADLTVEQVNEELRKIVAEQPDFVYNPAQIDTNCHYNRRHASGPECSGCIFGQVFQRLGVPQDSPELATSTTVHMLWANHHDNNVGHMEWYYIQALQDEGFAWGGEEIRARLSKL